MIEDLRPVQLEFRVLVSVFSVQVSGFRFQIVVSDSFCQHQVASIQHQFVFPINVNNGIPLLVGLPWRDAIEYLIDASV